MLKNNLFIGGMNMLEEIKTKSKKIYNPRIKEYFEEVLSNFENKNYRSSLVMLYTVAICDLVYKFKDLTDVYNSQKAKRILSDLKAEKELDPVSSNWENKLIEKAHSEAKIIENDMYTHLTNLKKYRNLSAHPVINDTDILYKPKKAETAALILNILDGLLTKHPLFMKEVFKPFVEEIAHIKDEFPSKGELEKYLNSKYFKHFNDDITKYIFQNLWKFSFNKIGDLEEENRKQNIKVLGILYGNFNYMLFEHIRDYPANFSEIYDKDSIKTHFIEFLQENQEIFDILELHSQQTILKFIEKHPKLLPKSIFVSGSFREHIEYMSENFHHAEWSNYYNPKKVSLILTVSDIEFLKQQPQDLYENTLLNELLIKQYAYVNDYRTADALFNRCIYAYLEDYDLRELEEILRLHNENPQCSKRNKAKTDIEYIEEQIKKLSDESVEVK